MDERPILFTPANVRSILAGHKRQTRRLVKPQPRYIPLGDGPATSNYDVWPRDDSCLTWDDIEHKTDYYVKCGYHPYGQPGDLLYVRERCAIGYTDECALAVDYLADGQRQVFAIDTPAKRDAAARYINEGRRPSIHMPKWAARLWLRIVAVEVERLRSITEADAIAEGIVAAPMPCSECGHGYGYGSMLLQARCPILAGDPVCPRQVVAAYGELWNSINPSAPWSSNPWVWKITFDRYDREADHDRPADTPGAPAARPADRPS